jgi:hypothetical protein
VFYHLELVNAPVGIEAHVYDLENRRRVARLGAVLVHDTEPVRIRYKKLDGSVLEDGWSGTTDDPLQIKREVANALRLPMVDVNYGEREDIDGRLRHGGIDPNSIEILRSPFAPFELY